ncbi:hypothetical protein [Pseudoalteromonas sp. Ps84H-4]|uniref:hypothetical protein n=1 Tax=Pseudoalteromonas sp. Ps84H-4 TaxID=2954502 RepID=UPI002096EF47|nr:hypothetical protein [Pseudoalteromonas sp. Ps84H-4]MCO7250183.1 hypothetical protein [Pseudoalteromonas sp. Ps84H-4]
MNEQLPNDAQDSGDIVLGDESTSKAISFQLAQAFYNELTGKSERLTEDYDHPFILTINDIEQLNNLITQSTAQFTVVSSNSNFAIKYLNNSSERFSSIERLKLHAGTKSHPVEEVFLNYSFLFVLPQVRKPQEYKVSIRLVSKTAKVESMKKHVQHLPVSIPLSQFEKKFTCKVIVDFVDVTVATNFMSIVNSWVNNLHPTQSSLFLKSLTKISHIFPYVCKYGLLFAGSFYVYSEVPTYFTSPEPASTSKFILLSLLFVYMLLKFGQKLGRKAERSIDNIYQQSYINFSKCDQLLYENSASSIRLSVLKSFLYITTTIFLGVTSSVIATFVLNSV